MIYEIAVYSDKQHRGKFSVENGPNFFPFLLQLDYNEVIKKFPVPDLKKLEFRWSDNIYYTFS